MLRDTDYARELGSVELSFQSPEGDTARIERLFLKKTEAVEIRFSWWKDGRMLPRPLDLTEESLAALMKAAIEQDLFSRQFKAELAGILTKDLLLKPNIERCSG